MLRDLKSRICLVFSALALGVLLPATASAVGDCTVGDASTPPTGTTCYFDLTQKGSDTGIPPGVVLNGGIFATPLANGELGHGTIVGTGVFQPFVRIQETANGSTLKSNGIEAAFNSDGGAVLDGHDKTNPWNHSIKLSDINIVTVNGVNYYEFLLDTNEQGNNQNKGISLDEFKVFTATTGNITATSGLCDDNSGYTTCGVAGATERYNMDGQAGGDASILMDYKNFSGSGNGVDLQALVPVTNFDNLPAGEQYVYLYSKFGVVGSDCSHSNDPCATPGGTIATGSGTAGALNYSVDAGFEEWSVRKSSTTPLPSTAWLLGLAFVGLTFRRRIAWRP